MAAIFPPLNRRSRDREFNRYSSAIRAEVIYQYLFHGKSHRSLDKEVVGQDPAYSKGWQSMGILHYLGLENPHKGIFAKLSIDDALNALKSVGTPDSEEIAGYLRIHRIDKGKRRDRELFEAEFEKAIKESSADSVGDRRGRLSNALRLPKTVEVVSIAFCRNPDVAAEVLARADGVCECCGQPAPFMRASDGTPYLEVHHTIRLADGGEDTVDNAEALCPNCHRMKHYGEVANN